MIEMKMFVGCLLKMGILCLPCRNDYWRGQERCWLAHTNFSKAVSKDRFNSLWHYLHLQDNSQASFTSDKCIKIRWFINYLVGRYPSVYMPGKNYFSIIFLYPFFPSLKKILLTFRFFFFLKFLKFWLDCSLMSFCFDSVWN